MHNLAQRAHHAHEIDEQPVHAADEGGDMFGHDVEQQAQEEEAHRDLDGEAEFHDVDLRRGARHHAQRHFHEKEGHHDRRRDLERQDEDLGREADDLIQHHIPHHQPAGRHDAETGHKALYHVEVAVQHQEGQGGHHPDEEGGRAGLVAGEGVGKVDHGKAHLEAEQLPARLDAHEQEVDRHAQHQAEHHLAQHHEHHLERMLRHDRPGDRDMRPDAQGEDDRDGRLDADGDIVGGKNGQHEHDDTHPHDGEYQTEHRCRIIGKNIHAGIMTPPCFVRRRISGSADGRFPRGGRGPHRRICRTAGRFPSFPQHIRP